METEKSINFELFSVFYIIILIQYCHIKNLLIYKLIKCIIIHNMCMLYNICMFVCQNKKKEVKESKFQKEDIKDYINDII